jgi:hypothetical protein
MVTGLLGTIKKIFGHKEQTGRDIMNMPDAYVDNKMILDQRVLLSKILKIKTN